MREVEFQMLVEIFTVWARDNDVKASDEKWNDLTRRLKNYYDYSVEQLDAASNH